MHYLVILIGVLSSCRMHIHRLFDHGLCTLWTQIAFHRSLYKHTHTLSRRQRIHLVDLTMKLDIPQILLSLLLVPVGIVYGHGVVVSEIMIGSDGVSPFYVEFYNLGEIDVDLSGAELSHWNNYDPGDNFEPYSATLPRGSILPRNGYYTIASESTIAGVPADLRIPLAGHTMKKESGTIILTSAQSGIIASALWGARNGGGPLRMVLRCATIMAFHTQRGLGTCVARSTGAHLPKRLTRRQRSKVPQVEPMKWRVGGTL
jgi:Lamin Tail Domain